MVALDTAQPAQRTNECELCRAEVDGNTEPHLLRKRNATLGLGLYFIEPIARREKVRGHEPFWAAQGWLLAGDCFPEGAPRLSIKILKPHCIRSVKVTCCMVGDERKAGHMTS